MRPFYSYTYQMIKISRRTPGAIAAYFYCFFGFLLTHEPGTIYMEEELFRFVWSFCLTVSVVPVFLFLLHMVWQAYNNSSVLIRIGRENYFKESIKCVFGLSLTFALYYAAGVYLLSAFFLSERIWLDLHQNLPLWLSKILLLFLFFCFISVVYLWMKTKYTQTAGGIVIILIASYCYWRKFELYGMFKIDLPLLGAALLFAIVGWKHRVLEGSFQNWR